MKKEINFFSDIKAIIFDLDGTIYLGDKLIGDMKNTLNFLREKGITIIYCSNNSSKTPDEYVKKFFELGIYDKRDVFYSSLDCAKNFLINNENNKKIYAFATEKVKNYLKSNGLNLTENSDADLVLLTFNLEATYAQIKIVDELLKKGVKYIATHPDKVCPTLDGSIPDLGAFIQFFKTSSEREPDIIIGKPNSYMIEDLSKMLNIEKRQFLMVGDRLYTDIAFGVNAKINTALVLSGETTLQMAKNSQIKADVIIKDANELKKYI